MNETNLTGEYIVGTEKRYAVVKPLVPLGRPNANVYLCQDEDGKRYVAKHFYNGSTQPAVAYGKKNHFGRRRDGNYTVFTEIQEKSAQYDFLVKHVERTRHKGKWVILIEFEQGELLRGLVSNQYNTDPAKVKAAIIALAGTLRKWHDHGFAHGDPHLDNALVRFTDEGDCTVTLIDYSLLHHKDFYYCGEFGCFDPDPELRIREDIENDFTNLGNGFKADILRVEDEHGWDDTLSRLFDLHYSLPA